MGTFRDRACGRIAGLWLTTLLLAACAAPGEDPGEALGSSNHDDHA